MNYIHKFYEHGNQYTVAQYSTNQFDRDYFGNAYARLLFFVQDKNIINENDYEVGDGTIIKTKGTNWHFWMHSNELGTRAKVTNSLLDKTGAFVFNAALYGSTFGSGGIALNLTRGVLTRSAIEGGSQLIVNGGDYRKIDVADVVFTGLFTPAGNAALGGAIDFKPFQSENQISIVGYNKDMKSALVDFGFKYAFGGNGMQGAVTNSIVRNYATNTVGKQAAKPLSRLEENTIRATFQTIFSISGKGLRLLTLAFKNNFEF